MTEQYPLNSGDPNAEYLISSADTNLPHAVVLVPGASGNLIVSDGTEWISSPVSFLDLAGSGSNGDITSLDTLNVFSVGPETYNGAGTFNVTGNNAYIQSTSGATLALPDSNTLNHGNASHRIFWLHNGSSATTSTCLVSKQVSSNVLIDNSGATVSTITLGAGQTIQLIGGGNFWIAIGSGSETYGGSLYRPPQTITTDTTLVPTSATVQKVTGATCNITFPQASTCPGKIFYFQNGTSSLTTITYTPVGGDYMGWVSQTTGLVNQKDSQFRCALISNGINGWDWLLFPTRSNTTTFSTNALLQWTGNEFQQVTPLGATNGGTGQTAYTTGDIPYASSSTAISKLAVGNSAQLLGGGTTPAYTYGAYLGGVRATVTTTTSLLATDGSIVPYSTSGSNYAITLPLASAAPGKLYFFICGSGSNIVTLTAAGSDNVLNTGSNTTIKLPCNSSGSSACYLSDGVSRWYEITMPFRGVAPNGGGLMYVGTDGANNGTQMVSSASGTSGLPWISNGSNAAPTASAALTVAGGGTGATTAAAARTNLAVDTFQSADQTITAAGALTLAHGLGRTPQQVWVALVNQTGEAGYTSGQVVFTELAPGAANSGHSAIVDATNLTIRYGSAAATYSIPHATTGANTALTNANWKARFFAR